MTLTDEGRAVEHPISAAASMSANTDYQRHDANWFVSLNAPYETNYFTHNGYFIGLLIRVSILRDIKIFVIDHQYARVSKRLQGRSADSVSGVYIGGSRSIAGTRT